MLIGTRIFNPVEVGLWDVNFIQITCYKGINNNVDRIVECARLSREMEIGYVIHPVGYSILDRKTREDLKEMAKWSDLGIILHDERGMAGDRLDIREESYLRDAIADLRHSTRVSFENANNIEDAPWFWERFADSITLDIGHIEAAGMDSISYIKSLSPHCIEKIDFVHMHRNNGWRGGLTDHWHLLPGCKEVLALKELYTLTQNFDIILEINEREKIAESVDLLKDLRNELVA